MPARRAFVPAGKWRDPRHRRGLWGERVAMAYLTSCGWSIEAHRFRAGRHDLDIVARRGGLVVFVEVKTRGSAAWGAPAESVGWRKRRAIERLAEIWRERYGRPADRFRFDVVEVRLSAGRRPDLTHIEHGWHISR